MDAPEVAVFATKATSIYKIQRTLLKGMETKSEQQYIVNGREVGVEKFAKLTRLSPNRHAEVPSLEKARAQLIADLNKSIGRDEYRFENGKVLDSTGRDVSGLFAAGIDSTALAAAVNDGVIEAIEELDEQKSKPTYHFPHRMPDARHRVNKATQALDLFPYQYAADKKWGEAYLRLAIYELQAALVMITGRDGNEVQKVVNHFWESEVEFPAPLPVAAHAASESVEEESSPGGEDGSGFLALKD